MAHNVPSDSMPYVSTYSSPYNGAPAGQASLKRRQSDSARDVAENEEKRQRIEVPGITTAAPDMDDDYLTRILAMAQAEALNFSGTDGDAALNGLAPQAGNGTSSLDDTAQYGDGSVSNAAALPLQGADYDMSGMAADPYLYMRIMSLPVLESLSTQILATLAQGPYPETIKIITQPESEMGQAYATMKSLFDQTKKIYSHSKPFLSVQELNIGEAAHKSTIRTTNLATFVSSVFGGQDVGFYELNDNFINTFVSDGAELPTDPGNLYLNLKTQMYLSAVSQEEQERTKDEILDDLFPSGFDKILMDRHPAMPLSQSEVEYVKGLEARREYLRNEAGDVDSISALSEKYAWEDFLKALSAHLKDAYEPLIGPYMRRHALPAPPAPAPVVKEASPLGLPEPAPASDFEFNLDMLEQATQAATQAALQSVGYGQYPGAPSNGTQFPPHLSTQPHQHHQSPYSQQPPSDYPLSQVPFHTQTAPTQVLYEQARQAAVAKTSPHSRRPGLPSQRRPWSTEEENALMTGLDQVKGPHWSQILALYGNKGQISEVLKDRNQVQLKDKARNLKLFFLKSNIEVPYYLQCVTGELKTRAPGQAARKEAEEKSAAGTEGDEALLMMLDDGTGTGGGPGLGANGAAGTGRSGSIEDGGTGSTAPTPNVSGGTGSGIGSSGMENGTGGASGDGTDGTDGGVGTGNGGESKVKEEESLNDIGFDEALLAKLRQAAAVGTAPLQPSMPVPVSQQAPQSQQEPPLPPPPTPKQEQPEANGTTQTASS